MSATDVHQENDYTVLGHTASVPTRMPEIQSWRGPARTIAFVTLLTGRPTSHIVLPIDSPLIGMLGSGWSSHGRTLVADPDASAVKVSRGQATADRVKRLHDVSGLTWSQISRLFGVSRRAVHNWATGGTIASVHVERLAEIQRDVEDMRIVDDTESTRNRLLLSSGGQSSWYQSRLAEVTSAPERSFGERVGEEWAAGESG